MTTTKVEQVGRDRFLEAQKLAQEDLGRCQGRCHQVMPIYELITLQFRNTVAMAMCVNCFDTTDLLLSMLPEGLNIKLVRKTELAVVEK